MEESIKIKGHHLSLIAIELIDRKRLIEIGDPDKYLDDYIQREKNCPTINCDKSNNRNLLEQILSHPEQKVVVVKGLDFVCERCEREKSQDCFTGGWEDEFAAHEYGVDFDNVYTSKDLLLILLNYAIKNALNHPLARYLCPRDKVFGIF